MPERPLAGKLIGEHPSIVEVCRLAAARSPVRAILIYGETGTGKGLVARALHDLSVRASKEFVEVNCAAIPASLLESELFGHERGAFTGAVAKKAGLIEVANGGTIFLDEIREMDLVLQAKLLTLLDTQRFRRIGSVKSIEVNVRFVAATNKILLAEVKKEKFREDLYYRLQVVAINMPALRERGDDIFILTDHFLRTFEKRYGRKIHDIEPAAMEIFRRYNWPGNVRELENLLERIFVLGSEETIRIADLPARILRSVEQGGEPAVSAAGDFRLGDFHSQTDEFHREIIRKAVAAANGNLGVAAQSIGLSRHALRHYMLKLKMPQG
jgi:transcriptional regulator with PAS, ATPase and Fis domain